jgi:hypothetical protein
VTDTNQETRGEPIVAQPVKKKRWRWHRHLWAVLGIWSAMFLGNEALRIYAQKQVAASPAVESFETETRHPVLEDDDWPTLLTRTAKALGGDDWNRDIILINLDGKEEDVREVLTSISRLKRLAILQIYDTRLVDSDLDKIAAIGSLQWVVLKQAGVSEEAVAMLRERMPGTFVSYFP